MGNNHSTPTCPVVDESGPPIVPIVGSLTFHKLSIIISGATAVWSCLVAIILIFRHATHFSNPLEQKQIIRIVNIIPCFALITLICMWLDGSAELYIVPALEVTEAFALAAFFLLMSTYVVPEGGDREAFFAQLEMIDKKGNPMGTGSLKWYKRLSILVLQWILISIILWIATAISLAAGKYCATSNKPHFAHIWITIFRIISIVLCIVAILRFYRRSKSELKPRGAFQQLLCFKIIVLLNFIQTFVFNFLTSGGHLHANQYLTFDDFSHGLPSLIVSCETALLAPFFFIAFSPARYIIHNPAEEGRRHEGYAGGPFGIYAILSAINIIDFIAAFMHAIKGRGGSNGYSVAVQNSVHGDDAGEYSQGQSARRGKGQRHLGRY